MSKVVLKLPRKRGPAPFSPTAAQRKLVSLYAAAGISEPVIAEEINVCQNTLRKHFEEELRTGNERELARNMRRLDRAADANNVAAMKYLDQTFRKAAADALPKAVDHVGPAPKPLKLGKKERARIEAASAGRGSIWEDDLEVGAPFQVEGTDSAFQPGGERGLLAVSKKLIAHAGGELVTHDGG